jgi:hypothetical protein
MHCGDQRHLGRFTGRAQAQIERPRHGIAPHRRHRGQIQDPAQPFTATLDFTLPAQRATVAIERCHSRKRGDLAAVKPAQLRQIWSYPVSMDGVGLAVRLSVG